MLGVLHGHLSGEKSEVPDSRISFPSRRGQEISISQESDYNCE